MSKYLITGMGCSACSAKIEKVVSSLPGVEQCSVNLLTNSMEVQGTASSQLIIQSVIDAGYGATLFSDAKEVSSNSIIKNISSKTKLILSFSFLIVLLYFSMGRMLLKLPVPSFINTPYGIGSVQCFLSLIILLINFKIFKNGFKSLIHFSPTMDTLVALGSFASFVYSIYLCYFLKSFDLYFEGSAMIICLISLGKYLESKAKGKTTNAIKELISLTPKECVVLKNNQEVTCLVSDLQIGDIFVVKPGQNIPVDGVIIEGSTTLNESAILGESIPFDKSIGEEVISATTNLTGFIKCRATKVGKDTTIAKIIELVSNSASSKAPVQKIADKVSGIFVPIVMLISLITFIVWLLLGNGFEFAILRGISVLVISCPCSLGLATPVAIMVGNGVSAKRGILFKNSVALENAGKVNCVVLDKTGTITTGNPFVQKIVPYKDYTQEQILQIAYSLEVHSIHPFAKAIIQKAQELNLKAQNVTDFKQIAGSGVYGTLDNKKIFCGRVENSFVVVVKQEQDILGEIYIQDLIKEDSKIAIDKLKSLGLKVIMLTGDNQKNADEIAQKINLDDVFCNVKPNEKADIINSIKKTSKVMMVGDGINDAAALTCSDVGVAIGSGSDIAIESADVILVKNTLKDVYNSIIISKNVLKNIHVNLFWAFFYNVIGIPLAAGCFFNLFGWTINPIYCALAMSLSSLFVVTNSLRLNRLRGKKL